MITLQYTLTCPNQQQTEIFINIRIFLRPEYGCAMQMEPPRTKQKP